MLSIQIKTWIHHLFRLNKIGKNPHLVSNRETLDSDCKTMNAIVNALSGGGSDVGSLESLPQSFHPRNNLRWALFIGITQKPYFLIFRDLGKMLAKANLPRASSHGNMFVCDTSSMTGIGSLTSPLSPNHQHRPDLSLSSQPSSFSKSDICLERPPPPQTLATFLENSSPSPSRQVRDWHYNKVSNGIRGMDLSRNGLTEECPIKYFGSSIVFVYSQISLAL